MELINIIIIAFVTMSLILSAVSFIVLLKYRKDSESSIAEILYLYTVNLRYCYNIRDLRMYRMKLIKDVENFFSSKLRKLITPRVYYINAKCLIEKLEERIQLLEMAGIPAPKIKENEEV